MKRSNYLRLCLYRSIMDIHRLWVTWKIHLNIRSKNGSFLMQIKISFFRLQFNLHDFWQRGERKRKRERDSSVCQTSNLPISHKTCLPASFADLKSKWTPYIARISFFVLFLFPLISVFIEFCIHFNVPFHSTFTDGLFRGRIHNLFVLIHAVSPLPRTSWEEPAPSEDRTK